MDEKSSGLNDLKLCGEQINLSSRTRFYEEMKKSDINKFRPHSALHVPSKTKAEYSRRPFSAGTLPTSPKLHSFLRYTHAEKSNSHSAKNNDYTKDFVTPGANESSQLFDKLVKDPINRNGDKKYINSVLKYRQNFDNVSENSSVDTCISLGTKIKAKAQTFDKLEDYNEVSGKTIRLKKNKINQNWTRSGECEKNKIDENSDECAKKLSIFVPNAKDDNTSSGVSSSSEFYNSSSSKKTDLKSPEKKLDCLNYKLPEKDQTNHNSLAGRVSFGKPQCRDDFVSDNDYNDLYSAFNTQLSLVEEESSQDSDISSRYIAYASTMKEKQRYECEPKNYAAPTKYLNCAKTDFKKNMFGDEYNLKLEKGSTQKKSEYLIAKYNEIKSNNPDDDAKFRSLEQKYRKEKYNLLYENDISNQYKLKSEPQLVSTFENNENNKYSSYEDIYTCKINSKDDCRFSIANIDEREGKLAKSFDEYKSSKHYPETMEIDSENNINKVTNLFTIPEIFIDDVPEKDNDVKIMSNMEIENMQKNDDERRYNKNNSDTIESKYSQHNYPQYLEKNDSRSYTSKVIEDYKKEINAINNIHDLTIKDLRKKCDDLKEYINEDSVESTPKYVINTTEDEDLEEKNIYANCKSKLIIDLEKSNKAGNNSLKLLKMDEYSIDNKMEKNALDSTESSVLNGSKDDDWECKNSILKPKLKRKNKKKEPLRTTKTVKIKKIIENKPNIIKKVHENKKYTKFKPQKIILSKTSSKFHSFPIDYEKDIISWMASRTDSPVDDKVLERKSEIVSVTNNCENVKLNGRTNTVHFENDIVPILKSSFGNYAKTSTQNNDSEYPENELPRKLSKSTDLCFYNDTCELTNDLNSLGSTEADTIEQNNSECNNLHKNIAYSNSYPTYLQNPETSRDDTEIQIQNNEVHKTTEEFDDSMTADYKDILKFLEKVEKSTNEDMSSLSHNESPFVMKIEELMELGKAELAHRAVVGTLAANKAAAAAAGLREALIKAARASAARLKAVKATAKHEISAASLQATQSLSRHQKFIEQLVNEKKALTERIEQLATTASNAESRHKRAEKIASERLQLELRNQKQRLIMVHQRDKQAWLKHHTQKIKEMTVKSLETELQEIERNHTNQLNKLQKDEQAAIENLQEKHLKDTRKLKEMLNRELEDAVDKERMIGCERLEKKRLEWEMAMAEASERADQEAKDAARRTEELVRNARLQTDQWKIEQEKELAKQRSSMEKEINDRRSLVMEELTSLKEKMMKELEEYKEEYEKNHVLALKNKEIEIRMIMRRERDKEIEKAIDCMEVEAQEERQQMQETLRRIKDKYENDVHLMEESEKLTIERCKEIREQLRDVQEQYAVSQIRITQLEGKLKQAEEIQNQQKGHSEIILRAAETKAQENQEELRAQIKLLQQQHKDEMHKLFAKVKVVISRKDDAVTLARREVSNLRERCMRLEARNTPNY